MLPDLLRKFSLFSSNFHTLTKTIDDINATPYRISQILRFLSIPRLVLELSSDKGGKLADILLTLNPTRCLYNDQIKYPTTQAFHWEGFYLFWYFEPNTYYTVMNTLEGRPPKKPSRESRIELFVLQGDINELVSKLENLSSPNSKVSSYSYNFNWKFSSSRVVRPDLLPLPDKLTNLLKVPAEKRKSILLHGPPGTGKTTFSTLLALQENLPVYLFTTDMNPGNLRAAVSEIDYGLMVFEDLDILLNTNKQNLHTLLQIFDGYLSNDLCIVATSNNLKNIPPALLRPGRVNISVYVGNADESQVKTLAGIKEVDYKDFEHMVDKNTIAEVSNAMDLISLEDEITL